MVLYLSFSARFNRNRIRSDIAYNIFIIYYIFFQNCCDFLFKYHCSFGCCVRECSVFIKDDNELYTMLQSFISSYSVTCDYFDLILGVVGSVTKRTQLLIALLHRAMSWMNLGHYTRNMLEIVHHCIVSEWFSISTHVCS